MASFISIVIIGGLIAFTAYEIVQLVRAIKERKKAKSIKEGDNDRNGNCD